jgi:HK97 gp10 family phage protein
VTTLKGGPELMQFLSTLPDKLQRNVMRGAMRAGARVTANKAKELVPVKTGITRKDIKVSANAKGLVITSKVQVKGPGSFKAPWIEYGTGAHWIRAEGAKVSVRTLNRAARLTAGKDRDKRALIINGHFVGTSVHHPGAKPKPFMRPALDMTAGAAVAAIGEYVEARLTKQGLDTPDISLSLEDDDE